MPISIAIGSEDRGYMSGTSWLKVTTTFGQRDDRQEQDLSSFIGERYFSLFFFHCFFSLFFSLFFFTVFFHCFFHMIKRPSKKFKSVYITKQLLFQLDNPPVDNMVGNIYENIIFHAK